MPVVSKAVENRFFDLSASETPSNVMSSGTMFEQRQHNNNVFDLEKLSASSNLELKRQTRLVLQMLYRFQLCSVADRESFAMV